MEITLTLTELFIGFGGLTALILTVAFVFRIQRNNIAVIWLVGFCLANVFVIFTKILYATDYIFALPHLLRWKFPIGLSRPVFFFLFILYLYKGYKTTNWKHMLHFIPVVLVTVYFIPFFFSSSVEKINWLNGILFLDNANLPGWYFYFISLYSIFYLGLSTYIFLYNKFLTQKLLNTFIWFTISGTIVFLIIAILNILSGGSTLLNNYMYMVLAGGFLVMIFLILASPTSLKISHHIKYQSSNIDSKRSREIFEKAKKELYKQKLYKDPRLKLGLLAEKINEPSYMLSHAINQQTTKTFNVFINQMRVEEAADIISNGKNNHLTLEAIGYEVGFNSRSSFYNAFKKLKNNTPASFKKTIPV